LENLFFLILAVASLYAFFKFGKIKASKKQTNRNDRINRFKVNRSKEVEE